MKRSEEGSPGREPRLSARLTGDPRFASGVAIDLLGLLNFITKKDYRPWFDKYVYGPETPQLVSK